MTENSVHSLLLKSNVWAMAVQIKESTGHLLLKIKV